MAINAGENVMLTCTATGTQPIQYKWLKDGNEIKIQGKSACRVSNWQTLFFFILLESKTKFPGPGILQLINVSTKENGVYSCDISNSYGSANQTFNLTVQEG